MGTYPPRVKRDEWDSKGRSGKAGQDEKNPKSTLYQQQIRILERTVR